MSGPSPWLASAVEGLRPHLARDMGGLCRHVWNATRQKWAQKDVTGSKHLLLLLLLLPPSLSSSAAAHPPPPAPLAASAAHLPYHPCLYHPHHGRPASRTAQHELPQPPPPPSVSAASASPRPAPPDAPPLSPGPVTASARAVPPGRRRPRREARPGSARQQGRSEWSAAAAG
ncbi:MAG: hypothetical protein LQ340_008086 [Diploschistes diacapsis]|nr:MAG: hypothetical protein LQ340_008086 [Diploschistes diacapsis]